MKPEDVLNFYGTKYRFGKDTGMSANTLGNWLQWGFIPEDAQYKMERITKGLLRTEWSTSVSEPSGIRGEMNL